MAVGDLHESVGVASRELGPGEQSSLRRACTSAAFGNNREAISWLGNEVPRSAMTLSRASRVIRVSDPRTHPTLNPPQKSLLVEPTTTTLSESARAAMDGGASPSYSRGLSVWSSIT